MSVQSITCEVGVIETGEACGMPAMMVMTTACMHGHTETFSACEDCKADAWNGVLTCTPCHVEHKVSVRTFPQVLA